MSLPAKLDDLVRGATQLVGSVGRVSIRAKKKKRETEDDRDRDKSKAKRRKKSS